MATVDEAVLPRAWSHDAVEFPLPDGHRFPLAKYRLLREALESELDVRPADPIGWDQLARVHDPAYLDRLRQLAPLDGEERRLGLPWSPQLVERARRSTGATVAAFADALQTGLGINLGGGTHHARRGEGRGYCVFGDIAAAVAANPGVRVLVVDTDVHQGDGTAELLAGHPDVVTVSLHGIANYPFDRPPSDIDVELPRGCDDDTYLAALSDALDRALLQLHPQVVVWVAGADAWEGDMLGTLALTRDGMRRRDQHVVHVAGAIGSALCVTLGGGYAPDIADTVTLNAATVRTAVAAHAAGSTAGATLRP